MERKYFEYQETKTSSKLAPAIFPEFHCVALSIVYTFHATTFFQTGFRKVSTLAVLGLASSPSLARYAKRAGNFLALVY